MVIICLIVFLTKNFLCVNRRKKNYGLIKHNKINTKNKLKVIKKSLDNMRTHYMTTQNNNLPPQTCPFKQKHIASDHIHVRTKFSNKLINHTVETSLIHTNTETNHICLTYILSKAQHSHKKKK